MAVAQNIIMVDVYSEENPSLDELDGNEQHQKNLKIEWSL